MIYSLEIDKLTDALLTMMNEYDVKAKLIIIT